MSKEGPITRRISAAARSRFALVLVLCVGSTCGSAQGAMRPADVAVAPARWKALRFAIPRHELEELVDHFAHDKGIALAARQVCEAYLADCVSLDTELNQMCQDGGVREYDELIRSDLFAQQQTAQGEPLTPDLQDRMNEAAEKFEQRMEESGLLARVRSVQGKALQRNLSQLDQFQSDLAAALGVEDADRVAYERHFRRALFLNDAALAWNPNLDFLRVGDSSKLLDRFLRENEDAKKWHKLHAGPDAKPGAASIPSLREARSAYFDAIDEYCNAEISAAKAESAQLVVRPDDSQRSISLARARAARARLARKLDASIRFGDTVGSVFSEERNRPELFRQWTVFWQRSIAPATCGPSWIESTMASWIERNIADRSAREAAQSSLQQYLMDDASLSDAAFRTAVEVARKGTLAESPGADYPKLRVALDDRVKRRAEYAEAFVSSLGMILEPELREKLKSAQPRAGRNRGVSAH